MDPFILSALFMASLLKAAIPGSVMLPVVARAARGGVSPGTMTALGVLLADALLLGVLWAVMLGAMELGPQVFAVLQVAGVAVLVLLGLWMLTASAQPRPVRAGRTGMSDQAPGAVMVLSSPVKLVFFLALVPQLVAGRAITGLQTALVAALVLIASDPRIAGRPAWRLAGAHRADAGLCRNCRRHHGLRGWMEWTRF